MLRRQLHRNFRKPLVVATPKSLLRHKDAVSTFEDMAEGTYFKRVLDDPMFAESRVVDVRRVVFCSGKVFYDLTKHRAANDIDDVALVRVEQLAPFPHDAVMKYLAKYPGAEVVWCQEEPQNMGAWTYVAPRLKLSTREVQGDDATVKYVGRRVSASPAAGAKKMHELKQERLVARAFE